MPSGAIPQAPACTSRARRCLAASQPASRPPVGSVAPACGGDAIASIPSGKRGVEDGLVECGVAPKVRVCVYCGVEARQICGQSGRRSVARPISQRELRVGARAKRIPRMPDAHKVGG